MVIGKKFSKKVESFTCDVCGEEVKGAGYTDHCPRCLWSKHIDVFPGDRQANCHGLMEPIGIEQRKGKWRILYRCQMCGYQRHNEVTPEDNPSLIIELSKKVLAS